MSLNRKNLKLSDIDKSKLIINELNNTVSYQDERYYINQLSDEIQEYCLCKINCINLTNNNTREKIKLSDFNLEKFKFDKDNYKVIIDDNIINISDIIIDEIRFYSINCICDMTNEKEICKYFIKSITINNHGMLGLNMELYNKIKSVNNKLYINKYIFMKYKNMIRPDITKELLSIYINNLSISLIDLIKDIIVIKNQYLLELILNNKPIILKNTDYLKLKKFAIDSHSNEVYDILTIYESLDYLSNDIYFEKVKKN